MDPWIGLSGVKSASNNSPPCRLVSLELISRSDVDSELDVTFKVISAREFSGPVQDFGFISLIVDLTVELT